MERISKGFRHWNILSLQLIPVSDKTCMNRMLYNDQQQLIVEFCRHKLFRLSSSNTRRNVCSKKTAKKSHHIYSTTGELLRTFNAQQTSKVLNSFSWRNWKLPSLKPIIPSKSMKLRNTMSKVKFHLKLFQRLHEGGLSDENQFDGS